jgi:hypothetical protein
MSAVPLSLAAFKRSNLPEAVTVNCVAEANPSSPSEPIVLMARGGWEAFQTIGNVPLRGVFQREGLFSSAALILANTTVSSLTSAGVVTAFTGTVAGASRVDMDGGQDADLNSVVRIATGSKLYKVASDGTVTDETSSFGDNLSGASSICYHRGYWIGQLAGSDQFYILIPGGVTWDALPSLPPSTHRTPVLPFGRVAIRSSS